MIQLDTRLPCLTDGYYMYYSVDVGRKHMYVFELTGEDVYVLRMVFRYGDKVKIHIKDETYKRIMLNHERTGCIFQLTEGEYLLELSGEI